MNNSPFAGVIAVCLLTAMFVPVSAVDLSPDGSQAPLSPEVPDRLESGLRQTLEDAREPIPVIIHFHDGIQEILDVAPLYTFSSIPAVYAQTGPETLERLARHDKVRFVESAGKPLEFHLDSATMSSRAKEVYDPDFVPNPAIIDEPSPALYDTNGDIIDGRGVGIAVVDSGIDTTHPDFQAPGKIGGNFLVTPQGVQAAGPYSVLADAHGTHIAGIAAGDGAYAAQTGLGDYRGAAPGASLYGFAVTSEGGTASSSTTLTPAIAFDWILQNGADQDPPIRTVVNGWSCSSVVCQELNPDMAHIQLAGQLAESGITVIFAVGNDGGSGSENRVRAEARIATPGVIGVGNHDDEELGGRDDCTKGSSSRGFALDATTWPDLIAPGDDVWSPRAAFADPDSRVPVLERKAYTSFSGTSASAGHLGGVVALIQQANASLAANEVEYVLKATAHKNGVDRHCELDYIRADPLHPWGGAHYSSGHGLVDAMEAVQLAMNFTGIPEAIDLEEIPNDFLDRVSLTAMDHVLYLDGADGLSEDPPRGRLPTARAALPGTEFVHTSQPLAQGFTTGGFVMDAWIGSSNENGFASFTPPRILMQVERLPAGGGDPILVGEQARGMQTTTPPLGPIHREAVVLLDEDVMFVEGDRVRATVSFFMQSSPELEPVLGNYVFYSDGDPTPTRLAFGERTTTPERGTQETCIMESTCARLGGDFQKTTIRCDSDTWTNYGVVWTGPPGSSATVDCNGTIATCTVDGGPGDPDGTCMGDSVNSLILSGYGICTYHIPGGQVGGQGECRIGSTS